MDKVIYDQAIAILEAELADTIDEREKARIETAIQEVTAKYLASNPTVSE